MMKMKFPLGRKAAAAMLIIALALSFASVFFSYNTYRSAMDEHYMRLGTGLARTAATQIDADALAGYLESGRTDEAYDSTRQILMDIQKSNDIAFLYVVKPMPDGAYYIFDTDDTENSCHLGFFEKYYPGPFTENLDAFLAGEPVAPIISNQEFGWLLSVFYPIRDSQGDMAAYVCADLSMNQVKQDQQSFLTRAVLILTLVSLLLAGLFLMLIRRTVVQPINRLSRAAAAFVSGDAELEAGSSAFAGLDIRPGDEIGKLYDSVRQMERNINHYIENLTAVTAEKERIGAELDVARHIQASMLPCIFPPFPERTELDIYATMTPAKEVGGDFYDFFLIDHDHLAMVMADVSGKGVPAALFMVIAKTLLKNVTQTGLSPKQVLEKVNDQLCVNNEAEMFVTVWLGILELSTGRLVCANAGHEYPVLRRAGGEYALVKDRHGFVLAGMEGSRYREYELRLDPGDRLYLYTDGVPEATDADNELYGTDRMLAALNGSGDASCETLLRAIKADIDAFVGDAPQFDDITMLSLEYRERSSPSKEVK